MIRMGSGTLLFSDISADRHNVIKSFWVPSCTLVVKGMGWDHPGLDLRGLRFGSFRKLGVPSLGSL